jgi:MFS transporter, DHA1 family, multidrug resistance protein
LGKLTTRWASLFVTYHTLIYLSIVSMIAELAYGMMNQSAIQPYLEQIGLKALAGTVIGTFLVVEAIFKSPMGSLGDRIGRRPLVVAGALVSAAAALGMTVAKGLPVLLVLRAFDGIAAAAVWPTMVAAVSGSVSPNRRTTAMSAITATYMIGIALGPALGGYANDATDSRLTSFYIVGALLVLTAVIAFFFVPHRSKEEELQAGDGAEERTFRLSDVLLGIKTVPDMMLLAFIAFFAVGLLIPVAKYFAMDELHMSETAYGIVILPIALAVAVVSLFTERISSRWGKARSVHAGIFLISIAMWSFMVVRTHVELTCAGMFLGIGFVLTMPAWLAKVSDMAAPRVRGTVIGALGTAQGAGAVIGTYLSSHLYTNVRLGFMGLGSHYTPFVLSAMALTICFVLSMIFVRENDGRRIGEV